MNKIATSHFPSLYIFETRSLHVAQSGFKLSLLAFPFKVLGLQVGATMLALVTSYQGSMSRECLY